MNYGMKNPCDSCPFVIAHRFPLSPERVEEIRDNRGEFPCHNTVDYGAIDDGDYDGGALPYNRDTSGESHCVGYLIVCWSDWGGFNQIQAMSARMGEFSPEDLPLSRQAGVFKTWDDMVESMENLEEGRRE